MNLFFTYFNNFSRVSKVALWWNNNFQGSSEVSSVSKDFFNGVSRVWWVCDHPNIIVSISLWEKRSLVCMENNYCTFLYCYIINRICLNVKETLNCFLSSNQKQIVLISRYTFKKRVFLFKKKGTLYLWKITVVLFSIAIQWIESV